MRSWGARVAVAVGVPAVALAMVLGPRLTAPDDALSLRAPERATSQAPAPGVGPAPGEATPGPTAAPGETAPSETSPSAATPGDGEGGPPWLAVPPKADATDWLRATGGLWSTDVPVEAGGTVRTVPGAVPAPRPAERVVRVRVLVEDGLAVDGPAFAGAVLTTLNDPRGWGHDGSVAFARTDGEADVDVTLASPATTDRLCYPVDTGGRVSCGRVGFAVLNAVNWARGAEPFLAGGGTVEEYRQYLVNHEVGHVLGHPHTGCPAAGGPAPIMLQQTLRLEGCRPNPWPAINNT
ncbi:DUF3152 domain-containing protein [Georgenia faecalis]|uniref:DUF3152 domain-containing protein n=1 Tax=Georgenia faecalis TaxID=2483799 RepID=A0ABV9D578_9MICO|nr:DUF3152 domain-containing protein [Georgenia faecalis]